MTEGGNEMILYIIISCGAFQSTTGRFVEVWWWVFLSQWSSDQQ